MESIRHSRRSIWAAALIAAFGIPFAAVRVTAREAPVVSEAAQRPAGDSRSPAESADAIPVAQILDKVIGTASLTTPGSAPFYVKGTITDHPASDLNGEFEESWVSPTKWRRTIRTKAFSQTLVVNGDKIYEQDSGDYFPEKLEKIVTEMVDPIPAHVADEIRKVDFKIRVPDGAQGTCRANKYDEENERFILTLNCNDGSLQDVSALGWGAGIFKDHRTFHGKRIGMKIGDNPLEAQIDVLRDLGQADETLFAIAEETPASNRIRSLYVRPAAYLKFIGHTPEVNWPQVTSRPESGTVKVDVDVDRGGHVRWAHSYVSSNPELRDFAVEQARHWSFEPFVVDGVPVQVRSTLLVEFKTQLTPDPNRLPPAKSFFDQARAQHALREKGSVPFHMTASFEAFGNAEATGKGTYEETWVSESQWRRAATVAGRTVVESRDGENFYRKFDGRYAPRRADDVMEALTTTLPGGGDNEIEESEWKAARVMQGSVHLIRLWRNGDFDEAGQPGPWVSAYSFAPDSGLLRLRLTQGRVTAFNGYSPFEGKQIARRIDLAERGIQTAQIQIEQLETITSPAPGFFTVAGVSPVPAEIDESEGFRMERPSKILRKVQPDRPTEALGQHGTVVLEAIVDPNGHVRTVIVKKSAGEALDRAAMTAVLQWEYEASVRSGGPRGLFQMVKVDF